MSRQVPSPSATAWLFALKTEGRPQFVVLRTHEDAARNALLEHLVEAGAVTDSAEAHRLVTRADTDLAEVVW